MYIVALFRCISLLIKVVRELCFQPDSILWFRVKNTEVMIEFKKFELIKMGL